VNCLSTFETIQKRRSIRKYKAKQVENEKVEKILEAARLGPSAANKQPCHFIVVTDEKAKETLRTAYNADWFLQAPVIIVGCVDAKQSWHKMQGGEYWKVDLAIAMQNMILTATELDLGTCWIAAFKEKAAKKALNIPKDIRVVAMTPLGYPDEEKGPITDRKPLSKMAHYNKW